MFRAHDARGDRLVAIKVFRVDLTPERAQELAAELQRLVALELTHPVIAAPIAAGLEGSVAYLAETYVPGESLDVALRQFGPAPFDEVVRVTTQLAGAIDFAGAVGAQHGGLHPRDVLVAADEIRLTGFGVARALEHVGVRSPVRRPYAAPERIAGADWGRPADVYSLAAIIHELLLGRRVAGTAQQVADNITDIAGADRDKVRAAFAEALAANPTERSANALSFANALRDAATGEAPSTDAEHTIQTRRRREKVPAGDDDHAERTPPTMAALPFAEEPVVEEAVVEEAPASPPADAAATGPRPDDTTEAAVGMQTSTSDTSPTLPYSYPPSLRFGETSRHEDTADDDLPIRVEAPEPPRFDELEPSVRESDVVIDPTPPTIPALRVRDEDVESAEPDRPFAEAVPADPDDADRTLRAPAFQLSAAPPQEESSAARPHRGSPAALAAMFVIGLTVGALGGYEYASRRAAQGPAPPTTTSVSATTPGREATEVAVEPPPPSRTPSASAGQGPLPTPTAPASGASAPAPAVPPPPPAAASAPGAKILVRSTPAGAQVTIDGDARGATPLTVSDLPYGTYTVRVARRGYAPQQRRVTITRGRPAPAVAFTLREAALSTAPAAGPGATSGSLAVESRPPGAAVFLNGRRMGETPTVLPALKTGSYAIRLELTGYQRWSASVRVVAGRQERVAASLERAR